VLGNFFVLVWGITATSASLQTKPITNLPGPKSITDKASASEALTSTLAVVATTNRALATAPREYQPDGRREDLAALHGDLTAIFKELHELLPKIASFRADITGWSVMNRHAE
jgi:hypothetical protein